MQVPDVIHRFRRRYRMTCHGRKEQEALVFLHCTGGFRMRPSLFACQATGERQTGIGFVQFEGLQPVPKFRVQVLHGSRVAVGLIPNKLVFSS